MKNIARQIICLQHILELFKMYNRHSEDILLSFFHRYLIHIKLILGFSGYFYTLQPAYIRVAFISPEVRILFASNNSSNTLSIANSIHYFSPFEII